MISPYFFPYNTCHKPWKTDQATAISRYQNLVGPAARCQAKSTKDKNYIKSILKEALFSRRFSRKGRGGFLVDVYLIIFCKCSRMFEHGRTMFQYSIYISIIWFCSLLNLEGRYGLVDKTHPSCARLGFNTRVQH